jgi:hypothetical protein
VYILRRKQRVLTRAGYIGLQIRSMNKWEAAYLWQAGISVGHLTYSLRLTLRIRTWL